MDIKKGDRVKLTKHAIERNIGGPRKPFTKGTVVGNPKGPCIRVLPDGHKNPHLFHESFWELDEEQRGKR